MSVLLAARHENAEPVRGILETELRLPRVPASFTLEDGKVVVSPDAGASVTQAEDHIVVDHWVITIDEPWPFTPRSERERELYDALAREPGADDLRQVYGDWLEESGHADEANVVAIERKLRAPTRDVQGLAKALRSSATRLPLAWRTVVTRPRVHCVIPEECPGSWEKLAPTDDAFVRRCARCSGKVTFAPSHAVARVWAKLGGSVALDVAVAEAPVGTTIPAGAITDLPFFSGELPKTIPEILRALELLPPDDLRDGFGPLRYVFPDRSLPAPSTVVTSIAFMCLDPGGRPQQREERVRYSDIAERTCFEFDLQWAVPADQIAPWLEKRFGPPRCVSTPTAPATAPALYRVYGPWLLADEPGGAHLRWSEQMDEWAAPPAEEAAALAFLRRVKNLLGRWRGCSPEALQEFVSDAPAITGMKRIVSNDKDYVGWDFWPMLNAQKVLTAFDIRDAYVDGLSYGRRDHIMTHRSKRPDKTPQYGKWLVRVSTWNAELTDETRAHRVSIFRS